MASNWKGQYGRYKEFFLNAYQSYKKKEDIKMFLEALLSLFATSFFIFFALRPTIITISELLKTIKSKETVLARMDTKIQNLAAARQVYADEEVRIAVAQEAVPDNPSPETFARQMEGLSQSNSVSLRAISVEDVVLVGPSKRSTSQSTALPENAHGLSFILTLSSTDYISLSEFLIQLQGLRKPVKVDGLTFSSSTGDGGTRDVSITVNGRVPYLGKDSPAEEVKVSAEE